MLRFLTAFSITIALGYALLNGAEAQNTFGACDNIKSTAEAMECVKTKKEKAQKDLNELFDEFAGTLEADDLAVFRKAQKEWLKFRGQQCELESALAQKDSLKTLYKMECVEKLTRARLAHLGGLMGWSSSDEPREFGKFPKWVNVIEAEHPNIFWELKSSVTTDLDCDGDMEHALTGIEILPDKKSGKSAKKTAENYHLAVTIGIIEDTKSGQPRTTVRKLRLDPGGTKNGTMRHHKAGTVCSPHITLDVIPYITKKPPLPQRSPKDPNQAKAAQSKPIGSKSNTGSGQKKLVSKTCARALRVYDTICQPNFIFHQDGKYKFGTASGQ